MNVAVFDMDGTLVDSEELAFRAAEEGLAEYWSRRGEPARIPSRAELRALVGLPSLEYFARLVPAERRGDAALIRELVARREVDRLRAGEGRLFPAVRETLGALRARGWKLAIVSNCGHIYFDANLMHLGLGAMVDAAFCLDHHPTKTDNVRAALAAVGTRAGVMVGDRAADLEAGRANGLRTIGATYGFGTPEELSPADARIASIEELLERLA
jgi:phosphoglycolate phosphatase-like HAD superfamily hydrolase